MAIDKIAVLLAVIGALNWGGIGLFGFDAVACHTASISLAIRQDCCGKSPCLTRKILVHPASLGYEYRRLTAWP